MRTPSPRHRSTCIEHSSTRSTGRNRDRSTTRHSSIHALILSISASVQRLRPARPVRTKEQADAVPNSALATHTDTDQPKRHGRPLAARNDVVEAETVAKLLPKIMSGFGTCGQGGGGRG